jgi:hypothetical protein
MWLLTDVCYDCFHYAYVSLCPLLLHLEPSVRLSSFFPCLPSSHHMQLTGYLNAQRKYHLEHHYKNYGSSLAFPFSSLVYPLSPPPSFPVFPLKPSPLLLACSVELGFGVTSRFWDWLFNTTYAAAPRAMSAVSGRRNPKGEGAVKTVGAGGAEKGEQCVMGMEGGRKVAALIV